MPRGRKLTSFTDPEVAVPLSEAEVLIKGGELAAKNQEIDKVKADAAAEASSARKKIRALDAERRILAESVRTRTRKEPAQAKFFDGNSKQKHAD